MYVATIYYVYYSRQESIYKAQFALYISDKPVTLKQSQGDQTKTPRKVIIMQSLKGLTLIVSKKKATLESFFKEGNMSLNMCKNLR